MRPVHRRILAAVLMPMFAAGALAATPPVTGLGQSWPNGADYSASPRFHAYVFDKQGVRYVQINDGNGTVRGPWLTSPAKSWSFRLASMRIAGRSSPHLMCRRRVKPFIRTTE